MNTTSTKVCVNCKRTLPRTDFYFSNRERNELNSQCKECFRKYFREYQQKNKEKVAAYQKNYYRENKKKVDGQTLRRKAYMRRVIQRLARMKGCAARIKGVCAEEQFPKAEVQYLWHHPGKKSFKLSRAHEHSREDVKKELKRAVPLCVACHKALHARIQRNQRLNDT